MKRLAGVIVWVLTASAAFAQSFDVVSIKPSPPPPPSPFGFPPVGEIRIHAGGRLTAAHATLRELVRQAFQVQEFLLFGGDEWVNRDRFDITATAPAGFSGDADAVRAMLRTLLRERFALVVRTEVRELPIYELRVARGDGRLGPSLRPSTVDCASLRAKRALGSPVPGAGSEPVCLLRVQVSSVSRNRTMWMDGDTLADVARLLTSLASRVVVDQTGLSGPYAVELTAESPRSPGRLPGDAPPEDGIALTTAVREQLGLRLDDARGRVEVHVIERAAPPEAN